jgi:hypothetical protein
MQAGFGLEPLAGEAGVQGRGAGDAVHASPGLPDGVPDAGFGGGRHLDGAVQVVNADPVGHGRCVDRADHREGTIHDCAAVHRRGDLGFVEVDIFARRAGSPCRAAAGGFGDDVAHAVVDEVRGCGRARLNARGQLLERVVGIGVSDRADGRDREAVALVVGVGLRAARAAVGQEVAAIVVSKRADRRSGARDVGDAVVGGRVAQGIGGGRAAQGRGDFLGAVADAVVEEGLRTPGTVGVLQPVSGRIRQCLVVGGGDVVEDVGEVQRVGAGVGAVE